MSTSTSNVPTPSTSHPTWHNSSFSTSRGGVAAGQGYPRRSPKEDPYGRADRASRGSLVIDKQVVEKIAGQAASEVAAAGGRSGGLFGIGASTDLLARPKVDVELSGQTATVDIDVAVAYPVSIRQSTGRVRDRVVERLQRLAGVTVTRLDITVTALTNPALSPHPAAQEKELL